MSMTPSKLYLFQNCQVKLSTDMHIHSETESSFCGQSHFPTALNSIMKEKIRKKQTVNHDIKASSLEPDSWYTITATLV